MAMSGGVDSSVAAALLHEQGYNVVGVFMRLGVEPGRETCAVTAADAPNPRKAAGHTVSRRKHAPSASLPILAPTPIRADRARGCCSAADAADARSVAARLGVPFYALNFKPDFQRLIDDFADEYVRGRTPNPCVRCNQWLKFGRLADYAEVVEAEWIATGHYARVRHHHGAARLFRSTDRRKDQSYVLFGVAPAVLAKTLFPLGELTKEQVRDEARRLGLQVHDKPDSQDICFVPDGDYARIVAARRPESLRPGDIRHVDGRVVGRHGGVATLTIGQRRGLDVALGDRVYVTALDAETGTAWVGPREALETNGLVATDVNWLDGGTQGIGREAPTFSRDPQGSDSPHHVARGALSTDLPAPAACEPVRADVQIRYHHVPVPATVHADGNGTARVTFDRPVEAVTPGQAAVFYREDEVLGGGWIERGMFHGP